MLKQSQGEISRDSQQRNHTFGSFLASFLAISSASIISTSDLESILLCLNFNMIFKGIES